jgi:hypothetical protein
MPNEVLFAGGRLGSVEIVSVTVSEVTTAGHFDSAYADAAIALTSQFASVKHKLFTETAGVLSAATIVSGETLFAHFEAWGAFSSVGGADGGGVQLLDSSGFPWIRMSRNIATPAGDLLSFYYNSNTGASPTWTQIGADFPTTSNTRYVFDIELTLGSPHEVKLYMNGSLTRSTTFTNANLTNIAEVRIANFNRTSGQLSLSQILATRGISTLGAKVKTCRATAAGASTGWSNSYTAVNEAINSDATLQNATSNGLKSSHAMSDVTVSSGFEIKSVFHWLRAKNDGTGPVNIKSLLRSGGTDYSTGNLSGVGLAYAPVGARYDLDPLGANWTQTSWNAIEAGYESAT